MLLIMRLCKPVLHLLDLLPSWVWMRAVCSVCPLLGLGGDFKRHVMVKRTEITQWSDSGQLSIDHRCCFSAESKRGRAEESRAASITCKLHMAVGGGRSP